MLIEKLLLSLVLFKTEFVASKHVTANNHFSEKRLIGELNEKVEKFAFAYP